MAETNNLSSLLRDFAQGASNSVASNVGVPVDILAWMLRKGGVNVPSNPVGGTDWMAEKGLTREPQNKLAGTLGDLAGFVAPFAAVSKAPQIAKGLLQAGENLAAPQTLNKQRGVFIGINAKNFDKEALAKALELEKQGVAPRQIWSDTGSMRSPWDKQWRQEIDDSVASIPYSPDRSGRADMFVKHPELFNNYPDMAGMGFKVDSQSLKPMNGSYSAGNDLIELGSGNTSTGLHELQHAIQGREGFASGGNTSSFKKSIPKNLKDVAFNRDMQEAIISRKLADNGIDIKNGDFLDFGKPKNIQLMQDMIVKNPELKADFDSLNALNQKLGKYALSPQAKYERLAGEAEARAVQSRMNMDASQRRATYPLDSFDVPIDQLITRFGDSPAVSQGNERLLKILERNGESAAPAFNYPQSEALKLAQQRAALPTSEGGLGLPANNTAMDRARAMDFMTAPSKTQYHATREDVSPLIDVTKSDFGFHTGTLEQAENRIKSRSPTGTTYPEGANIMPLMMDKYANLLKVVDEGSFHADSLAPQLAKKGMMDKRKSKDLVNKLDGDWAEKMKPEYDQQMRDIVSQHGYDGLKYKNAQEGEGFSYAFSNPDVLRSRFAAFDPWRRNAAIAASMGVAAPDLLANPLNDENNRLIDILRTK